MPVFDQERWILSHDDGTGHGEDREHRDVKNENHNGHHRRFPDTDDAKKRKRSKHSDRRPEDIQAAPEVVGIVHALTCADDRCGDVGKQRQARCGRRDAFVRGVEKDGVGPAVQRQRAANLCVDLPVQVQDHGDDDQDNRRERAGLGGAQRRHVKDARGDVVAANRCGPPSSEGMLSGLVQRLELEVGSVEARNPLGTPPTGELPRLVCITRG